MYSVSHVALSVIDIRETIEFYKKFGFKVIKEWEATDHSIQIVHLKLNNVVLELFCYKKHIDIPNHSKKLSSDLPVIGTKHFALGVKSIDIAHKDLIKKGIIPSDLDITLGRLGKQYFFITDPNGILIEIIED
ncbi:MAG: VOC family protein [Clostridia bacterium]|nr:VOC family protein [Clostridia bacterium]